MLELRLKRLDRLLRRRHFRRPQLALLPLHRHLLLPLVQDAPLLLQLPRRLTDVRLLLRDLRPQPFNLPMLRLRPGQRL
ncbi:MAG: hypothetical protein FLDDKLPJ_03075 [Phycisphaerae bacterium]|nr:hypothetical protein [Phycisphaerae bacterium]